MIKAVSLLQLRFPLLYPELHLGNNQDMISD